MKQSPQPRKYMSLKRTATNPSGTRLNSTADEPSLDDILSGSFDMADNIKNQSHATYETMNTELVKHDSECHDEHIGHSCSA